MARNSNYEKKPRAYRLRDEAARRANALRARRFRTKNPHYNDVYIERHRRRKKEAASAEKASAHQHRSGGLAGALSAGLTRMPPITSAIWRIIAHIIVAFVMAVIASRVVDCGCQGGY